MNKYKIAITKKFKKDLKTAKIRGYDLNLIQQVVDTIASGKNLIKNIKIMHLMEYTKVVESVI